LTDKNFLDSLNKCKDLFHIYDGAFYFAENIEHLKPKYTPSKKDLLMTRIKTTGINRINVTLNKKNFSLIDLGGQSKQKNKKKEWKEGKFKN
jgi:hypothetical protein